MNIHMRFSGGKPRALTFSYDDGVRQEKRLVEIFNRHAVKGTFNIIPGLYGKIEDNDSVWYATNIEIYDYVKAYESLVWSAHGRRVYNPTMTEVFFELNGKTMVSVKPDETVELKF